MALAMARSVSGPSGKRSGKPAQEKIMTWGLRSSGHQPYRLSQSSSRSQCRVTQASRLTLSSTVLLWSRLASRSAHRYEVPLSEVKSQTSRGTDMSTSSKPKVACTSFMRVIVRSSEGKTSSRSHTATRTARPLVARRLVRRTSTEVTAMVCVGLAHRTWLASRA
jgi:hypothetical protein